MLLCYICGSASGTLSGLMNHLKVTHKFTISSHYMCRQGTCVRSFQSSFSFRRHMRAKHRDHFTDIPLGVQFVPLVNNEVDDQPFVEAQPEIVEDPHNPANLSSNDFKELLQQSAHAYSSKLYASSKITRSQVQSIVADTSEFLASGFIKILKDKVLPMLPQDQEHSFDVSEVGSMFDALETPFHGLDTEYLRIQKSERSKFLMQPQSFVIGERMVQKTVNGTIVLSNKAVTGQFIPLRLTLKYFFELPDVLSKTLDQLEYELANKDSAVISNFVQGQIWQHILANTPAPHDAVKIPIFLYFDDFEVNNPLGSRAGVHKLGGLYFTIPVIPPEFQAKLENIFVGMLFQSSDRAIFGNRATFDILLNELTFLETEGITIVTENGPKKLCFIMSLLLGDNLGMHSLLGLVESFRANYCCRFCKASRDLTSHQLYEDVQLRRSELNYEVDVDADDVTLTGIKELCVWNDLPSFHCAFNLSCDVMHDLMEGVCKYDMAKIIFYLVYDLKLLTLITLNDRIKYFSYGSTEIKNKPSEITKSHLQRNTLLQSASQMLCLVRYFSIMIGDLVPEENEVWKLYLTLVEIVDITTAKSLQKGCGVLLRTLIAEHNEMYLQLFHEPLKPKFHHLVHYPRLIELCGPLVNLWSMRGEAKHKEAKVAAHNTTSRTNIAYTLAFKNQLKFSHRLNAKLGFISATEFGPGRDILEIAGLEQFVAIMPDRLRQNSFIVTWTRICSILYKRGNVLVLKICDDLPKFATLKEILVDSTRACYFIVKPMSTISFVEHLHAYEVSLENEEEWACIEIDLLLQKFPTDIHLMANGKSYVSLRNAL